MSITKRVPSPVTESTTRRIASFTGATFDPWGGAWGTSWANAWLATLPFSSIGQTSRVPGGVSENITKRVASA